MITLADNDIKIVFVKFLNSFNRCRNSWCIQLRTHIHPTLHTFHWNKWRATNVEFTHDFGGHLSGNINLFYLVDLSLPYLFQDIFESFEGVDLKPWAFGHFSVVFVYASKLFLHIFLVKEMQSSLLYFFVDMSIGYGPILDVLVLFIHFHLKMFNHLFHNCLRNSRITQIKILDILRIYSLLALRFLAYFLLIFFLLG